MAIELFDIDKGYALFSKSNYQTKKHTHYAIEVVRCTKGFFNIATTSEHTNIKSVIIPPNLPHSFNCLKAECDLLFVDPLSDMGKYVMESFNLASHKDVIINPTELNQFLNNGTFNIASILNSSETYPRKSLDDRILKCIDAINSLITESKITITQLSEVSLLSESRLAHLFKEQLGISVHQCILWKKLCLAMLKSREGYTLTESAHYVGFSDSSHFNKVFYKMFGINPFFVLKS
ncbi:AraC family transcriptional regulator [Echinicola marina]|uniref:helix-turn-helix domain-containing protein n=1 Tax=Echinicola marina TaxID=2859768 RepID=UPI001CF6D6BD|nr:AraC family transcriptional regulator [Echinicola marina]UCS95542.1 AraC family transcriptional regulator [Echinicola marina]